MKMRKTTLLICLLSAATFSFPSHGQSADAAGPDFETIRAQFADPPSRYGVDCWWWWLNGNVSKASITRDLEAMKSRKFYGAMIFDAGGHNQLHHKDIPAGPLFGSKDWCDLFSFALDEAERLGLEIGFNIQSGWNLGGPCVTPEYAAKTLTYSEAVVEGGASETLLPQPETRKGFYRDIAVLAFPIDDRKVSGEPVQMLDYKLGVHELGGGAPDCRFLLSNERKGKAPEKTPYRVSRKQVRDLTGRMDPDGRVRWTVPAGKWVLMRIGYTCTNAAVSTSSAGWQGNVLDYMSPEAFDFYWNTVVEPILRSVRGHVGKTLKYMETDSWECGGMNWSDRFADHFRKYCGYDPVPWLPVIGGYVVDDMEATHGFLADFRKAIADAVAVNHYGRFAEYAHRNGMGIQPESAGPHAGPLDGIKNYSYSDIMMSEFWVPSPHRPTPRDRFYVKQAASAAHILGRKIVGAESFTSIGPHWNDELWSSQKPSFDHEVCSGLNRVYFHTFTASPPEMGLPGQEYFAGTHINPRVTWWNESAGFIDYLRRTQLVAQEGRFQADILYYYGDHVPNVYPFKEADLPGILPGYDYDVTDENTLLRLTVDPQGRLVVPSGLTYAALVLPDHRTLSLAAIEKVRTLLRAGATVIGGKPERCVSRTGGEKGQRRFRVVSAQISGPGKGRLVSGMTARNYLLSKGLHPDFEVSGRDWQGAFDYIHYKLDGKDCYFVCNQTGEAQHFEGIFRTAGHRPEFWNPLDGSVSAAHVFTQRDGRTRIPLVLDPYGSLFVVFNAPIPADAQGTGIRNFPEYAACLTLEGPWQVHFDPAWGGPDSVLFNRLTDWTLSDDDGIRYYSGAATCTGSFIWNGPRAGRFVLQLGSVKDVGIATVRLNGRDKGICWTPPFRVDVTDALVPGRNTVEIRVVNSWYNRVAGDQLHPDRKPYTSTNILLRNDFRGREQPVLLSPSGLLGPVKIMQVSDPVQPAP